ncbi:exonuclease domain-containing protein [Portibacter marinus]|uniref:exonuclease domain-containing protein n=1 Tax=Portibacter marinus TaxID=2898660 RepID=UPI001F414C73|nr:exonuclease domain-containing protein [Portibacter marinus]
MKKYAIIDIETTGGMAKRDKITEIGVVVHDGNRVLETYETLINPGRSIPPNIVRITGITDEMVADAPRFYEVAKKIVELTEGAIFVAHNVRFDYTFIKEAFKDLGYTYSKRQLDTVRLARKTFPGLKSYSLGNLIKHFGIEVNARHRALADAMATTELLEKIFKVEDSADNIKMYINHGLRESQLPKSITMERLHQLPEECGVYYFYNSYGKVVYIGKSVNIKKRVIQHFVKTTKKAENLQKHVDSIDFELTGSELISLLHESREIKLHQPEINRASRNKHFPYFVHHFIDDLGYLRLRIEKTSKKRRKDKNILSDYSSLQSAKSHIKNVSKEFTLCLKLNDLESGDGPCFDYKLGNCLGACILKESVEDYNERANLAISSLSRLFRENFILVDQGRHKEEYSVILVEEGYYRGFGYATVEDLNMGIEEIKETINYVPENPETNNIVRNYILEHPHLKIISF